MEDFERKSFTNFIVSIVICILIANSNLLFQLGLELDWKLEIVLVVIIYKFICLKELGE